MDFKDVILLNYSQFKKTKKKESGFVQMFAKCGNSENNS